MTDIFSIYPEASNFLGNKYVGKYIQISLITQRLFTYCVYFVCVPAYVSLREIVCVWFGMIV